MSTAAFARKEATAIDPPLDRPTICQTERPNAYLCMCIENKNIYVCGGDINYCRKFKRKTDEKVDGGNKETMFIYYPSSPELCFVNESKMQEKYRGQQPSLNIPNRYKTNAK